MEWGVTVAIADTATSLDTKDEALGRASLLLPALTSACAWVEFLLVWATACGLASAVTCICVKRLSRGAFLYPGTFAATGFRVEAFVMWAGQWLTSDLTLTCFCVKPLIRRALLPHTDTATSGGIVIMTIRTVTLVGRAST